MQAPAEEAITEAVQKAKAEGNFVDVALHVAPSPVSNLAAAHGAEIRRQLGLPGGDADPGPPPALPRLIP